MGLIRPIVSLTFLSLVIVPVAGIPCKWNKSMSQAETIRRKCGFLGEDPWNNPRTYEENPPLPCCCAPQCYTSDAAQTNFVGINWSDKYARHRLARETAFSILKRGGFRDIKLFSPDGLKDIMEVYGEEVNTYVGIPNRELTHFATDEDYVTHYIKEYILPHVKIVRLLVVGNEPLICIQTADWASKGECGSLNIPAKLLPALKMVKKVLTTLGHSHIPVTTAFNGGILEMSTNPWTPCVSDFKLFVKPLLRPVWEFLRSQTPPGPFMVNIYSWFASMAGHIPPTAACGSTFSEPSSDGQYKYYFNYDMQHDMQRVALCVNEVEDLELWIGETGWPSALHPKATSTNAHLYYKNVVNRAQGKYLHAPISDNIRFKEVKYPVFLFQAFDELKKFEIEHGNLFENAFGIYTEDGTPKWIDTYGNIDLPMKGKVQGPYLENVEL